MQQAVAVLAMVGHLADSCPEVLGAVLLPLVREVDDIEI